MKKRERGRCSWEERRDAEFERKIGKERKRKGKEKERKERKKEGKERKEIKEEGMGEGWPAVAGQASLAAGGGRRPSRPPWGQPKPKARMGVQV